MRTVDSPSGTAVFGPGGRQLATVGYPEKAVRIWSPEDGALLARIPLQASGFALTPDGRYAVLGRKEVATVWDLRRDRAVRDLGPHWDWVEHVEVDPDGQRVFTYDDTPRWRAFELASGRTLPAPPRPTGLVRQATVSRSHLAWCSEGDPWVRRWDFVEGVSADLALEPGCGAIAATLDEQRLAVTVPEGQVPGTFVAGTHVVVFDLRDGQRTEIRGSALRLAFTPDGRVLAAAREREVRLLDAATGELLDTVDVADGPISDLAISADQVLAVVSFGRQVSLYRLAWR